MRLPPHTVAVIYLTPLPRLIVGPSGRRYHVKPNLILIDANAEDAETWIATGQARRPLPADLATREGYLTRAA